MVGTSKRPGSAGTIESSYYLDNDKETSGKGVYTILRIVIVVIKLLVLGVGLNLLGFVWWGIGVSLGLGWRGVGGAGRYYYVCLLLKEMDGDAGS